MTDDGSFSSFYLDARKIERAKRLSCSASTTTKINICFDALSLGQRAALQSPMVTKLFDTDILCNVTSCRHTRSHLVSREA